LPDHPKTAKSLDGIGCFRSARDRKQVLGRRATVVVFPNLISVRPIGS